ncbi:twin-arginine translocase TatA/TatE family subunit [Arenibaculum pallidiluteum]|uniref:twin-arginine translocase TatA/TatE family subunit n=1 Tax=Arenibaculum pallidiluteum TaxID=2812559 RepID=UPI001A9567EC|nr:twin-arginine translocase TatA/TatE family subunit [Arenibaculum pallidiluteum]
MGSFSLMHWIVVLVVVILLFGAGRIPQAMGDLAKGMKSFKRGLSEDEPDQVTAKKLDSKPEEPRPPAA